MVAQEKTDEVPKFSEGLPGHGHRSYGHQHVFQDETQRESRFCSARRVGLTLEHSFCAIIGKDHCGDGELLQHSVGQE